MDPTTIQSLIRENAAVIRDSFMEKYIFTTTEAEDNVQSLDDPNNMAAHSNSGASSRTGALLMMRRQMSRWPMTLTKAMINQRLLTRPRMRALLITVMARLRRMTRRKKSKASKTSTRTFSRRRPNWRQGMRPKRSARPSFGG